MTGVIVCLGYIGNFLFNRKGIPDNLILILFGIALGPALHLIDPTGFINIAPIFSGLALLIILFDGGMNLNLYKVLEESPKAMVLGVVNVLLSMALTAAFTSVVLGWELLHGLLLGTIVGGTSSSIVLSLTKKMDVPERINTLMSLESVFTDAIVIVLGITLLDLIVSAKSMVFSEVAKNIASAFSIGVVFGLICGLVWLKLLSVIRDQTYDDILTLSVTLLFYGLTEVVGGNGAIFALIFGLVLGNGVEIGGIFRMEGIVEIGGIMRKFMNQMSFFIRTYFFVYLGLILFIENSMTVLYSVALSLLLLGGRFIGVMFTTFRDPELGEYNSVLTSMMPRGLAAAIMAQLVASSGIAYSSMFPELIMIVIIVSVVISSVGAALLKRRMSRDSVDAGPATASTGVNVDRQFLNGRKS
ncbi:MAG TPA: cation:proton antiporter [Candidatus Krumholzibacteriaceae bacterium]|nr:cation:proton antiporter [Candidatus Krumholzibacteriaceae bacterium]